MVVEAEAVLISGDISEGADVAFQLQRMAESIPRPIYFVLGNHDFYQSSIARTRQQVIELCREHPQLSYLSDCGPVSLSDDVVLLGDDGWGDATVGDYEGSLVRLNDFDRIEDFRRRDPQDWKSMLRHQGEESAARLRQKIDAIPQHVRSVLVTTHVPPFREACWYEGKTTDDNWAPFFVCGQVGRVLRESARERPDCRWTVLCGHTHNAGVATIAPNLIVYTGGADYGHPEVEGWIEVDQDVTVHIQ